MKKFSSDCCSHFLYNKGLIFRLLTGVLILVAACSTALYIPSRDQSTSEAGYKELLEGREIYINKCASCHSLIIPERYDAKDWNKWVETMGPKAKLLGEEKHLVLKYLTKGVSSD
jgi:CxxC motif-containing protein (DUF1111 family)